ncbi:MAG TPA: S46 family peptidase, partial [Nannocystis exedens]|nr:S46 family peptidase [Nannocystis exedens]
MSVGFVDRSRSLFLFLSFPRGDRAVVRLFLSSGSGVPSGMLWHRRAPLLLLAFAISSQIAEVRADEGQWMPEQIPKLDHQALRERGLERTAQELWDPAGGGLLRAAVNLNGCSASLVSAEGLVITNHHCAYAALQASSTVDRDLLKDGFLAKTRAEEEPAKGRSVRIVQSIDDVTQEVLAAAAGVSDERARLKALRSKRRQLVKECDAEAPGRRCEVASFFGGSQYRRIAYLELQDIRLVYAPPSSIGEFGGEIDNWMWPRHTGDFAVLRAYAGPAGEPRAYAEDNVPYRPEHWLKVSAEGIREGDFVAVLGYPGRTTRYLWVDELVRRIEDSLPAKIDLYGEWIAIAEELGGADPAVAIKVAATKKSLANVHKNSRGMLDGVAAMGLIDRRRSEQRRLEKIDKKGVIAALSEITARQRRTYARDFLRSQAAHGPTLLSAAVDVVRWARERGKPEEQQAGGYLDRDRGRRWRGIQRRLRDHDPELAANLLAAVVARAARLPQEDRIEALDSLIGTKLGSDLDSDSRKNFLPATRRLFAQSKLAEENVLKQLFDGADPEALRRSKDPLLVLAGALVDEIEIAADEADRRGGALLALKPAYFELLRSVRSGPIYADANGTLRISVASVRGYQPRDGMLARPQTTLQGQLAKLRG